MTVIFHPEFPNDIRKFESGYAEISSGLAARFRGEIDSAIAAVKTSPQSTSHPPCSLSLLPILLRRLRKTRRGRNVRHCFRRIRDGVGRTCFRISAGAAGCFPLPAGEGLRVRENGTSNLPATSVIELLRSLVENSSRISRITPIFNSTSVGKILRCWSQLSSLRSGRWWP